MLPQVFPFRYRLILCVSEFHATCDLVLTLGYFPQSAIARSTLAGMWQLRQDLTRVRLNAVAPFFLPLAGWLLGAGAPHPFNQNARALFETC